MLFSQIRQYVKGILANSFSKALSNIAPKFDPSKTYAKGDRIMYSNELYVFNTAHTGAWAAADADKSDVDSEMPEKLTAAQMQAIKAAFVIDAPRNSYPVLFDETGAEHFVGWYKLANGTKKPVYQKTITVASATIDSYTSFDIDTTTLLDNANISVKDFRGGYYADKGGAAQQFHSWGNIARVNNLDYGYNAYYRQGINVIRINGTWGGMQYTISDLIFTVQYTKTTDTPQ